MHNFMGSLALAVVLFIPVASKAQDRDQNRTQANEPKRYYDKQNKDWHSWDDRENQSYQRYQQENRRPTRDFDRLSDRQRQDYFRWQHQHSTDDHRNQDQRW
jgi:hypothetical protein